MQIFNNICCLSYAELTTGILSIENYRKYSQRGKIQVVRRACRGTEALIAYDNMPEDLKAKVRSVYGDNVRALAAKNPLKDVLELDVKARDFFATYKYSNGLHIKTDKQKQYTATASALNAINTIMADKKGFRKALGGSGVSKDFYKNILESLKAFKGEWGWNLPNSERYLRQKLTDYKGQNYEAIISKKDCNQNALRTKEDEQQSTLRQILRHPNNLNDEQVLFMYNEISKVRGWRTISVGTVANRREEWKLTTTSARRGASFFENNISMQVKRKAPGYPMMFWSMDGWDVELLYQKSEINAQGNTLTTYHNRLTVVVVLDTFNKYPIGYAIGTHETPDLIKAALKNALLHTKELFGCIHRTNQLQTDHYAIKSLMPLYDAITSRVIPARVGNAKAKPIEPYFASINKKHCQLQPNWSGFNVTASTHNQPNVEYRNKIRHSFPDEQGCRRQIINIIEAERKEKQAEFKEKWQDLPTEYKLPWKTEQYLYNTGETTGNTNRLQPDGLTITINKQPYTYDSFEVDFRNYSHIDWIVKYDKNDMTNVLAHSTDGSIRFLLTQKYVQPMALVERTEGDAAQLALVNNYNKDVKELVLQQMDTDSSILIDMFNQHPQLNDTLAKMTLVDSMGQHKDRKNAARLMQQANKVTEKQDRKVIAEAEADKKLAYQKYLDTKININEYL